MGSTQLFIEEMERKMETKASGADSSFLLLLLCYNVVSMFIYKI